MWVQGMDWRLSSIWEGLFSSLGASAWHNMDTVVLRRVSLEVVTAVFIYTYVRMKTQPSEAKWSALGGCISVLPAATHTYSIPHKHPIMTRKKEDFSDTTGTANTIATLKKDMYLSKKLVLCLALPVLCSQLNEGWLVPVPSDYHL